MSVGASSAVIIVDSCHYLEFVITGLHTVFSLPILSQHADFLKADP